MIEPGISEISSFLKEKVAGFRNVPISYHEGKVISVGDGVARVAGLPGCLYGELLEFRGCVYGMAMDLSADGLGAVLFDNADTVAIGDTVLGTGRVAEIPVGEKLLGRVVDPIGRPMDGKPLEADRFLPAERPAPSIIQRRPIDTPLETGILAIDSMIPIGRGQRELIIGDRQTGKTSIALDAIFNQKDTDVYCVYCAIGQKASSIAYTVQTLRENGAMDYTVVVASPASDSPATQYLAPYCACSIAEGFMQKGADVLVVYDDLSKHAVAYRAMSLLLHRPPGREAYPGDIFYLHSRLLERSAALKEEFGGGTITALPIIETTGGNISAYIPTNVISITDGQIYLESELFHSGVRPAVNTGLSVSRVGKASQHKAMRGVSGTLRIDLAQYRELAVFTRFGSDIDESTGRQLRRGACLVDLLKQGRGRPYSLFQEVAVLTAYRADVFLGTPSKEVPARLEKMFAYLHRRCASLEKIVNAHGEMDDEEFEELKNAIAAFGAQTQQ